MQPPVYGDMIQVWPSTRAWRHLPLQRRGNPAALGRDNASLPRSLQKARPKGTGLLAADRPAYCVGAF